MDVALRIENLRKSYGSAPAVDGVDLTVEQGQIVGVLGPNGSGKTTTVECAYGLRRPDSGRIRVFGLNPLSEPGRVARLVGTQLQDSALPDRIRVGEALHLFAALARSPVDERQELERWGLAARRRASFGSLSGGQRQRLLVALALVGRPRLVFLDEMTTGLDPNARREVWDLVEQVRRGGTTVVLVTHFMDEAFRLCDRVAVLKDGHKVADGTPGELIDRYGGGTTVRFSVPPQAEVPRLAELPGVLTAERVDGRIEIRGRGPFLVSLGHTLAVAHLDDVELDVRRPSLEDAYVQLVGPEASR
ncbi:ABC transporter ATP-binding protein [Paractinoplanes brasiliensis]|uniref:ABC transporter ATP-binding protein n=1 Tax=Paractinoplanes brasiliensis TaxID=52695 RepID=UPI00105E44FF|nr:ABC transporter ATP-binding protein [Actinoplanes brasiliensis]